MAESAAAHAAAIAQAIKASGVVVRPRGGFLQAKWRYLTTYKGLAFFAESPDLLPMPGRAQVIEAKTIWIPR